MSWKPKLGFESWLLPNKKLSYRSGIPLLEECDASILTDSSAAVRTLERQCKKIGSLSLPAPSWLLLLFWWLLFTAFLYFSLVTTILCSRRWQIPTTHPVACSTWRCYLEELLNCTWKDLVPNPFFTEAEISTHPSIPKWWVYVTE